MALKVSGFKHDGEDGPEVRVDNAGDTSTAEHFAPSGCDAPPLDGDFAALTDAPGAGGQQAVGYNDTKNQGKAKPGEVRHYARDANGAIVGWFWAKGDGTVVLENEQGVLELAPSGNVRASKDFKIEGKLEVSGEIKAGGAIEAGGEITWNAATVPTKASTHTHPTAMGPSGPPIPGS